jgi:nitroimidazol reductase NimA-like FMN-containing flavoprotein (pyridoxamine 5'-phosphate oxidase superfamily)
LTAEDDLRDRLHRLFEQQKLGVLSTHNRGEPYASLVAFAATDDLKQLVFATPRATRKFSNMTADARAAMLVDSRSNRTVDFRRSMAATAIGSVREIRKAGNSRLLRLYLEKHPHLRDFVHSPSCAVLRLDVRSYYAVDRFQHVMELHLT